MQQLTAVMDLLSRLAWGPLTIVLLLGTGIYLTLRLRGLQFIYLVSAFRLAFSRRGGGEGDISHFQALMTALAGTIGTGNIVGVATAIFLGGPGAVFWMWFSAIFGMATKYAEAILAVKYRIVDDRGTMAGGPMYYLARGLRMPRLGAAFAFFAILASLGVGASTQANSIATALYTTFGWPVWVTAIVLVVATAAVTLGGIQSIGRVSSVLVPAMAAVYISAVIFVLSRSATQIPATLVLIWRSAFTPLAAVGGFAGSTFASAVQRGISRGIFSNEAGLGSAPIAAAAARTDIPAQQALVSMTGTFIDSIIVNSLTALALISSGLWSSGLQGAEMTTAVFNRALPGWGGVLLAISLSLFAYSTILGWAYYGEKCAEYLWGSKVVTGYRFVHLTGVGLGAIVNLALVWSFSDVANALMAFPNLIGLLGLGGVVVAESRVLWSREDRAKVLGLEE